MKATIDKQKKQMIVKLDSRELKAALQAEDLALALWDMDQWLRSKIKYGERNEFQEVRDQLNAIIRDYGVQEIVEQ